MNLARLGAATLLGSLSVVASADIINMDFESYALGPIANGYNGWQVTNPAWDQAVTSTTVISGSQSWRMSNSVASGSFGDQPFSPALTEKVSSALPTNKFVASLDFMPVLGGVVNDAVVISLDNGTGQRGSYMRIQNSGGLNNSWQLDVFDYDGTNFINTVLASNLNAGQVYQLGFEQTFNPGALNDTWSVSLNGTNLFNGIGWEDYFVDQSETVMPYDRLLFRAGGASVANAKGVVFDNVRYASVPEPASMTALALGGLALLKRKRKQSS